MQNDLYHCAPIPLGAGSIICPGNWGRIKRRCEVDGVKLARESILEDIRRREFGTKPSRLDGAFVCPTLLAIEQYRTKYSPVGIIYRVELLEPGALSHSGDYELISQGFVGIDGMEDQARRYWASENMEAPELLTLSRLRIVECIDQTAPMLPGLNAPSPTPLPIKCRNGEAELLPVSRTPG